ncbi:MAG: capsule assembly Wzi family protein [Candidatus Atribacteria bacterium]|nr:capsule assembly Wzi family protein [bacterium]MCG2761590.1 capsule assembly Wzi family protein [Candidatus Atribacteria bacterium]
MVKKDNNFILYPIKIMLLILIIIIFFTFPTKTILASPLNYVPLDHWVYTAISRLETLRAFDGNDSVATNTLPLTRIEIAYLIDTALSNIQKGKIEFKDSDLTLMEKLVLEFQDELTSINVKVISINSDTASSATTTTHPSDNWLYESLNYFAQQENIISSNLSLSLLSPRMSRKDMAILLDEIIYQLQTEQIQITSLTEQDIEKLEALIIELNDELSAQGLKIVRLNKTTVILDNLKSTLKMKPYFTQKINLFYPENINLEKLNLFSELGARVSASISENTALYLDASIYTEGESPLQVQLNQAYIALKLPSFEIPTPSNAPFFPSLSSIEFPALDLMVGRDSMRWGPGYQGNLILSNNPPAFDMIKYSGTIDLNDLWEGLGKINFTKFFSLLDSLDGQNRYFSGQRLEYKLLDALTLGLSETAIISQDSSILFYNPLPFIPPYYVTWWIASMLSPQEVNCNVALDAEINLTQKIKLYGEWMADDFIFFPEENPFPNRTGFLAGAYFADPLGTSNTDFRIEYTHINNYVYFPTHPWQDYLYQGEYIGNPLGPDADQLYLELTHRLSDEFNLSLSYNHQRHGEGQVGTSLPSDPIIANENIFLSGIIEKQQAYQAEISYTMSPQWVLSVSATLENIKNKDNTVGENENNTYFQLELNYQF